VVGTEVGVLDAGAPELGEGNDDEVVPGATIRVAGEEFPEGVDGPADGAVEIRVCAGDSALSAVGVEAADLGAGDHGVGLVKDEGGGL
jgi:hypothetical protein